MKKKLLITSSLITILLALFPVSLYAEEVVQDPAPANTSDPRVLLDSYFYQNYDILPYIESTTNQYIDTGIKASNNLKIYAKFSNIKSDLGYIFSGYSGTYQHDDISLYYNIGNNNPNTQFYFYNNVNLFNNVVFDNSYTMYEFLSDKNVYTLNNYSYTFTDNDFESSQNIKIFASSNNNGFGKFRLYSFYIYDYSLDQNDDVIGFVRYYYPAKAKSSGTIGLYDSISKTFFPSLGTDPFANPTDDKVLHFQIGDIITAGLTWIGDILDFAIDTPIILFFLAVGLAGAMYRWARRLVHF